jgi:hypothetical protein
MELGRRGFKPDRDRVARGWQGLKIRGLPEEIRLVTDNEIKRPQETHLGLALNALAHEAHAARNPAYDPGY